MFPERLDVEFVRETELRYGENPHQRAAFYSQVGSRAHVLVSAEYYHADLVDSIADRDWYQGYSLINNPAATNAKGAAIVRNLRKLDIGTSPSTSGKLLPRADAAGGPASDAHL